MWVPAYCIDQTLVHLTYPESCNNSGDRMTICMLDKLTLYVGCVKTITDQSKFPEMSTGAQ